MVLDGEGMARKEKQGRNGDRGKRIREDGEWVEGRGRRMKERKKEDGIGGDGRWKVGWGRDGREKEIGMEKRRKTYKRV